MVALGVQIEREAIGLGKDEPVEAPPPRHELYIRSDASQPAPLHAFHLPGDEPEE